MWKLLSMLYLIKILGTMGRLIFGRKKKLLALLLLRRRQRQRQISQRRFKVHPLLHDRLKHGEYFTFYRNARDYPDKFHAYMRMTIDSFDNLLALVLPLQPNRDPLRYPVNNEERLVITLKYLATGADFKSLGRSFRLGASTIGKIVRQMASSIYNALVALYLKTPTTQEQWLAVADGFNKRWQLPNCCGALDGKHITMRCPRSSGSLYYNYKKTFSIVLLALCDANYCFSFVDIGSFGRNSDGGVFGSCALSRQLEAGVLPPPSTLPNSTTVFPHYIVADEAFALTTYCMRPYPLRANNCKQFRVYNYRITRARRIIENTFGICASKWRLLLRPIDLLPATTVQIVKAIVVLHNYVRIREGSSNDDVAWQQELTDDGCRPLSSIRRKKNSNRSTQEAMDMRELLGDYFMHDGAIEWQDQHI